MSALQGNTNGVLEMTDKLSLWRISTHYTPELTWLIVAKSSEDALNFARAELKKDGYEEDEDYDFGYPEHWDLDEGNIIDANYDA